MENKLDKSFSLPGKNELTDRTAEREPLVRISPDKPWYDLDWRGMWRQRDLLRSFVMRDIRLRYRQTLLGILWAIIQPLAPLLIFSLVFSRFFSEFNKDIPYSVYVFCGLVPWLYFSNAVTQSGNSLSHHSFLIGKIYFPRLLLPLSSVLAGALDFAVGLVLLLFLFFAYGIGITWGIVLLPLLWMLLAILALAIGAIFASLSVVFRDVRNLLPFVMQLGLFLTPVIYPAEALPKRWQWILTINPLTGIIENMRAALLSKELLLTELGISLAWTLVLSFTAMVVFVRVQKYTADYL